MESFTSSFGHIFLILYTIFIILILLLNYAETITYHRRIKVYPDTFVVVFSSILKNLDSDPILNLQVVNKIHRDCPSPYRKLQLYEWSTVENYCILKETNAMFPRKCKKTEKGETHEKKAFPLYNWKEVFFCVENLKKQDYLYTNNSQECANNNGTMCSQTICVLNGFICPINEIKFVSEDHDAPSGHEFVGLIFQHTSVYISRNLTDTEPIVNIGISQTGLPCLNPIYSQARLSKEVYPIVKPNPAGCDKYGVADENKVALDYFFELDLYQDNYLLSKFGDLPGYHLYIGSEKVILYNERRIKMKINPDCDTMEREELYQSLDKIQFFHSLRQHSNSLTLIGIGLISAIWVIFLFLSLSRDGGSRFWNDMGRFPLGLLSDVTLVINVLHSISQIIMCVVGFAKLKSIDENSQKFYSLANIDCFFEDDYNILMDDIDHFLRYVLVKGFNSSLMVIHCFFVFVIFVLVAIIIRRRRLGQNVLTMYTDAIH